MKSLEQLRSEANRAEEAAFMALRHYLHDDAGTSEGTLSWDTFENSVATALMANRQLRFMEKMELAKAQLEAVPFHRRAVNLGPDLRPDEVAP